MSKAASTRHHILEKAFELIYLKGYQATSIDEIIAQTAVTKGAFFYHFKNKEEMGLAMINEVMYPGMTPYMIDVLGKTDDVLNDIYTMLKALLLSNPFFKVEYGCPAVNLVDEMAPINKPFRKALSRLMVEWQRAIEEVLTKAQSAGRISKNNSPKQVALFITSGYSGARNMGKVFGKGAYEEYLQQFKNYLSSLK
ncbi:TetR/AcrR family transcriptional regulator [Pedobacter sp. SYP-B3415]|uniref:TetR/AcrR family transcriptional regulator n=1 Tax=Pedobacter sp. SYP-B3415 TaxID=2496641 RepID=UPI00101BCD21|nr:TetR/AcrR family transcriptional regulator [Pedobacter sp. SYP-B3415]